MALCTHAAEAASPLAGHWNIVVPSQPAYLGTVLVDREGRATLDAPIDYGRPASYRGYIAKNDGQQIEVLLTDGSRVIHMRCAIQSSEFLTCRNVFPDGSPSAPFTLTRVGPGPASLFSAR